MSSTLQNWCQITKWSFFRPNLKHSSTLSSLIFFPHLAIRIQTLSLSCPSLVAPLQSLVDSSCPLHLSPGSSLLSTSFFFSFLFFLFLPISFFCSLLIILLTYMSSFHGFKTVNIPAISTFLPPIQISPKRHIFNYLKYDSCQHIQNAICDIRNEICSISADCKSILPVAYVETLEWLDSFYALVLMPHSQSYWLYLQTVSRISQLSITLNANIIIISYGLSRKGKFPSFTPYSLLSNQQLVLFW